MSNTPLLDGIRKEAANWSTLIAARRQFKEDGGVLTRDRRDMARTTFKSALLREMKEKDELGAEMVRARWTNGLKSDKDSPSSGFFLKKNLDPSYVKSDPVYRDKHQIYVPKDKWKNPTDIFMHEFGHYLDHKAETAEAGWPLGKLRREQSANNQAREFIKSKEKPSDAAKSIMQYSGNLEEGYGTYKQSLAYGASSIKTKKAREEYEAAVLDPANLNKLVKKPHVLKTLEDDARLVRKAKVIQNRLGNLFGDIAKGQKTKSLTPAEIEYWSKIIEEQ